MSAGTPQPMAASQPPHGATRWRPDLVGPVRLLEVVNELAAGCVWTQSIAPLDMLHQLRSECDEVELEVTRLLPNADHHHDGAEAPAVCHGRDGRGCTRALVAELGDVLFDALMVHAVFTREFKLDPLAAWKSACRKVEGRTPYMPWGDGSARADTVEEAEAHWQAAKRREKLAAATSLPNCDCSCHTEITTTPDDTHSNTGKMFPRNGVVPADSDEALNCRDATFSIVSRLASSSFATLGVGFALGVAVAVGYERFRR